MLVTSYAPIHCLQFFIRNINVFMTESKIECVIWLKMGNTIYFCSIRKWHKLHVVLNTDIGKNDISFVRLEDSEAVSDKSME